MNINGMIQNYAHLLSMGKEYPPAQEIAKTLFFEIQKQIAELVLAGEDLAAAAYLVVPSEYSHKWEDAVKKIKQG